MSAQDHGPRTLEARRDELALRGTLAGAGAPIVLLHGLTATRDSVVHGSRFLARAGFTSVLYDARGHGESDPAPAGTYSYSELGHDLAEVLVALQPHERPVVGGHSMGAHTALTYALDHADRLAGIVLIGPAYAGVPADPNAVETWLRLADGLDEGGVDGFLDAYDQDLDAEWRDTLLRIARERLQLHAHPAAVAQALREIPASAPFESLDELDSLELPALVVASRDQADPAHPHAIAETYAERLPNARLISEAEGDSPLAWQGGRLSREIAAFCEEPSVRERR